MILKICLTCKKEFTAIANIYKYCCRKCSYTSPIRNGLISVSKISERNINWKGDKVGYASLHRWVYNKLQKPKKCSCCNKERRLDLANISQKYKRDILDWEWLCRKCHMNKDGRLQKIKEYNSKRKLPNIDCKQCGKNFKPRLTTKFCSKSCAATFNNLNNHWTKNKLHEKI